LLFINLSLNANILLYFYMTFYNLTLLGIFWLFFSVILKNLKTLYSFSMFSFSSSYLFFLTIFLFSLAGVPPFLGFFNKLFLMNLLINSGFFLLYFLFFIILLFGLYFYMQNLRFLHSTNHGSTSKVFLKNTRVSFTMYYYLITLAFFLINGVFIVDDLIIIFSWILY